MKQDISQIIKFQFYYKHKQDSIEAFETKSIVSMLFFFLHPRISILYTSGWEQIFRKLTVLKNTNGGQFFHVALQCCHSGIESTKAMERKSKIC